MFTVTGSPAISRCDHRPGSLYPTVAVEQSLAGMFIGLIAVAVVGAMFFTAEYRHGLIRVTLAAMPRHGAVLAAKAVVIGAVAFVTGTAPRSSRSRLACRGRRTRASSCCRPPRSPTSEW